MHERGLVRALSPGAMVCVTGAGGFIASWLVRGLLDRGVRVRGTVRSLARAAHLRALPHAPDSLELVEADLLNSGSFDAAVAGCDFVFHTASPYVIDAANPQRDLVDPAVNGTRNVLASCARATTVRRVVLTSSMVAVTDEPESTRVYTEADWNTKSRLDRNPYYLSKTLAERAAWAFVEREAPRFDLVAINPFMVIGPSLGPGVNASNQVLIDLVRGVFPAIVDLSWAMVDVRDVADAHIRAAEVPAARGRYLCGQETVRMRELVGWLASAGYGEGARLPRLGLDTAVGSVFVRLVARRQSPGAASYLRTHVGRTPHYDTTRIRTELGMRFRALKPSILETMDDLRRWGLIGTVRS